VKLCPTCGTEYGDDQKFCPKDGSALRGTRQGDLIGSVIAERYHISKKLGEGGMGAVYLGEHVKMGRKSAIKVMSASMSSDAEAIARFNREAMNASRINHPNVCAIYDFGETADGLVYLAMEFIEGGSLGDLLDREGTLTLARAADILLQTAEALQAAHDLGIVHRDLKPDNIMLARGRGGADLVKVVDFGIAKAMSGEEGQQVTKTGLVVGTPEYMSPEQLSGDKLDGRSDTYSLALVFYRMVTGTFPFQAESAQEMMIKRLTDDPLPLGAARPDIVFPTALEQTVRHALGRMPGERHANAVEFARELHRAVGAMGAAATAAPMEAATQIMSAPGADATVQLTPTRVGGAATAPPARAATARAPTPTTPQPVPAPRVPEKKKAPVAAIAAVVVVLAGAGGFAAMQLMGNGTPGTANDTTGVVTVAQQDTGSVQPGGGQPQSGGGQTQPGGGQTQSGAGQLPTGGEQPAGGGETARPPVDSVAVHSELAGIEDRWLALDVGQSLSRVDLSRLEAIVDNTGAPASLRTRAAWLAAGAVAVSDSGRACNLARRGLDIVPGDARLRAQFTQLGCR
jgi:eukaryotic-like serine/threonine-protein kinase